jgi:hypothetical protein
MFNAECVSMLMICLRTTHQMHRSNGSFVTNVKRIAKSLQILYSCHVVLLHDTDTNYLKKVSHLSNMNYPRKAHDPKLVPQYRHYSFQFHTAQAHHIGITNVRMLGQTRAGAASRGIGGGRRIGTHRQNDVHDFNQLRGTESLLSSYLLFQLLK